MSVLSPINMLLTGTVSHAEARLISCPELARGAKTYAVALQGGSRITHSEKPEEKENLERGDILG